MDFQLTEQQETIVTAVAKICAAFDDAYWLDRDTTGEFPQDFAQAMADGGWLAVASSTVLRPSSLSPNSIAFKDQGSSRFG